MALFYTDKNSQNRLSPSVNGHDVHLSPKALSTDSIAPRAEGTQTGARTSTKNDKFSVYDDNNHRIILGRLPDGTMGLEISLEGYDVEDAYEL